MEMDAVVNRADDHGASPPVQPPPASRDPLGAALGLSGGNTNISAGRSFPGNSARFIGSNASAARRRSAWAEAGAGKARYLTIKISACSSLVLALSEKNAL
jgi:hypothetical protein